jgi:large subunit ribosomal protein L22
MVGKVEELDTPSVRAGVKHLRVSPTKVRQVLSLIRGLAAEDAERVLQLCQKDAADDVLKVLDSAVANAENNRSLPIDELYVARAYADEGPTRKWGQPRARGRYFRVRHRTSHVTIVLARYTDEELEQKREREQASSRVAARGSQRRRAERVRRSRAAQHAAEHDHDHEHDEEEAVEETPVTGAEIGPASEEDVEVAAERDEDLEAADEAVAEETGDVDEEESE